MKKTVRLLVCAILALAVVGAALGVATPIASAKKGKPAAAIKKGKAKAAKRAKAKAKKAKAAKKAAKGKATKAGKTQHGVARLRFVLKTAAEFLGLERSELIRQLAGHSLAQVAVANGKTAAGLEDALASAFRARLDKLVAAQKITEAQAARRLERFQNRVHRLVNRVFTNNVAKKVHANRKVLLHPGILRISAKAIGISVKALRAELPGHSLAQIAAAHGKTAADVQNALVAAVKAKLDKLVANQRITQQRADRLLARFTDRVDDLVAKVQPAKT